MEGSVSYLYGSRADAADPQAVARRKIHHRRARPVRNAAVGAPAACFITATRRSPISTAWGLTAERRAGRQVPRTCVDPRLLDYEAAARFGTHVEHFFEVVGRERCFVSVYDDLAADPSAHYRRLLDFLGLPDDGRTDFRPRRPTQGFKIGWLQRLLKRPPKVTQAMLAGEKFRQRIKSLDDKKDSSPIIRRVLLRRGSGCSTGTRFRRDKILCRPSCRRKSPKAWLTKSRDLSQLSAATSVTGCGMNRTALA